MSEVIRTVRVGSAHGRLIRQSDSQGLRLPAISGSGFHIVTRGTCWLIRKDDEPVALEPGDVVLTTSGRETEAPLATIARQVGYATEFAFSGAFRREYRVSPGRFRRDPAADRGTSENRPPGDESVPATQAGSSAQPHG